MIAYRTDESSQALQFLTNKQTKGEKDKSDQQQQLVSSVGIK